jgi:SAM-dependent methyltransferase
MQTSHAPHDWYRSSFGEETMPLSGERGAEERLGLALKMLGARGDERVLDVACATGRRTYELCRRGFSVISVDASQPLLEIAGFGARDEDLDPYFVEVDPREMLFESEFDLVLSMGGGAFGHFESDEEDLRAFAAVARALRPGGRLLMQMPNVLHVEAGLPPRTWLAESDDDAATDHLPGNEQEPTTGDTTLVVIDQRWDPSARCIDAEILVLWCQPYLCDNMGKMPFRRRLYSVEELAEIFGAVGLRLADVFDENGARCAPTEAERELFVVAKVG